MSLEYFIEVEGIDFETRNEILPGKQLYRYKGKIDLKDIFPTYRHIIIPQYLEIKNQNEWMQILPIFREEYDSLKSIHVINIEGKISTIHSFMIEDRYYQRAVRLGLAKN